MTNRSKYDFNRVIDTLTSPSTSLRELAENTGFDVFSFYQKADLSGLDLANQDLRGLNFNGANLRGVLGTDFESDEGAFNGCITDSESLLARTDDFDCFIDDVLHPQAKYLYAFARFRPDSLEQSIELLRMTSQELAEAANLSTATVRKARKSQVVALDSAAAIGGAIRGYLGKIPPNARVKASAIRQPMIAILELPNEGKAVSYPRKFKPIPRPKYAELLEMSEVITAKRNRPPDYPYLFRDSPAVLKWLATYYIDRDEEPDWTTYPSVLVRPKVVEKPGPLFDSIDD